MSKRLRLGTRGSDLALTQATIISQRLTDYDASLEIERVVISTEGDRDQTASLSEIGGKGVFTKDIEAALLREDIDIAVHSFKDLTSQMHDDLCLVAFLAPESQADALILRPGLSVDALKQGGRIATGSFRRRAILQSHFPGLEFLDIRGNVGTRLRKMETEDLDGIILSEAGLKRLDLEHHISHVFDPEEDYPAPGQGVIAVQARRDQSWVRELLSTISDPIQESISRAEFLLLEALGFDCQLPLGVFSQLTEETLVMKGFLANSDSEIFFKDEISFLLENYQDKVPEFAERFKSALRSLDA